MSSEPKTFFPPQTSECSECGFDFVGHIYRMREFSLKTFGPGAREKGVIMHIQKELVEIEKAPTKDEKIAEWIDVMILAIDGCWRVGATPNQIVKALLAKQTKNEGRKWPDWRTASPDVAIEHDRSNE